MLLNDQNFSRGKENLSDSILAMKKTRCGSVLRLLNIMMGSVNMCLMF